MVIVFEKIFIDCMDAKSDFFSNYNWFECYLLNRYYDGIKCMRTCIKAKYLIYATNENESIAMVKKEDIPSKLLQFDNENTKNEMEQNWRYINRDYNINKTYYGPCIEQEFIALSSVYRSIDPQNNQIDFQILMLIFLLKIRNWRNFLYKIQENHLSRKHDITAQFRSNYIENDLSFINDHGIFCESV